MSRSATIVAAYLMYTQKVGPEEALDLIRRARPAVQPNPGFLQQLEVFHAAAYQISHKDKATRMYYLERTVEEVMNGDGSLPETTMFASGPSTPVTSGPQPKRRIRCKMCRQELAAREHMLDHGQLGPPTPFVPSALSPAPSRRPSMHTSGSGSGHVGMMAGFMMSSMSGEGGRRPSMGVAGMSPMTPLTPGEGGLSRRGSANVAPMTPLAGAPSGEGLGSRRPSVTITVSRRPSQSGAGGAEGLSLATLGRGLSESLNTATFDSDSDDSDDDSEKEKLQPPPLPRSRTTSGSGNRPVRPSPLNESSDPNIESIPEHEPVEDVGPARVPGIENVPAAQSGADSTPTTTSASTMEATPNVVAVALPPSTSMRPPAEGHANGTSIVAPAVAYPQLLSPSELTAQLYTNPKLAALRSPSISGQRPAGLAGLSMTSLSAPTQVESPPILVNPKCSGYFVEPMKWMQPFLQDGQVAGKIMCPNKKCGAKLGNYEWPGMQCGCREWVTPGFCINRSKVDEIV
ncbi:hypothetical protein HWV62_37703 [Athelia sp. TMB]|nr:hypothetical protein HWV62_37703 [Athelia sp. TMB]